LAQDVLADPQRNTQPPGVTGEGVEAGNMLHQGIHPPADYEPTALVLGMVKLVAEFFAVY